MIVSEKQIFEKPASLSHEQGAAIPVNYLTAWQLLVVMGALKPEETVLIHNAGGGVGLAAIDIALHIGATIFGTASGGKHAFLKQRGLHKAIDYRTKDWTVEFYRLTGGKGVELITDPIGGNHWKKSYRALRSTGRLGMFGISAATQSRLFGPLRMLSTRAGRYPLAGEHELNVFGVNLGHEAVLTWSIAPRSRRRIVRPPSTKPSSRASRRGACVYRGAQEYRQDCRSCKANQRWFNLLGCFLKKALVIEQS